MTKPINTGSNNQIIGEQTVTAKIKSKLFIDSVVHSVIITPVDKEKSFADRNPEQSPLERGNSNSKDTGLPD